jgi:hypothetical protein
MAAAAKPPVGTVIEAADGSHAIYDGKNFVPAAQDATGNWGRDQEAMARLGMGGNGGAGGLSTNDQKQVADMQGNAAQMEALSRNTADFMARNKETATGGILALPFASRIAKAVGLDKTGNLAAMDRDNIASATQMRAPGMRMTQMEFGKFLGATPSVQNDGHQNTKVAQDIANGNTLAQAKASFFTSYLNHHRTLDGAIPAWLQFSNTHFDPTGNYLGPTPGNAPTGNAALKQRSAAFKAPVTAGSTVDVFGRPVGP